MIVKKVSSRFVLTGNAVTIYGAGFSTFTIVRAGEKVLDVVEYSENELTALVNVTAGAYNLSVNGLEVGKIYVTDEPKQLSIDRVNFHSLESFQEAILGLFPRGFAWFKGKDGNFAKLALAIAYVVQYLYNLFADFRENVSPTHTKSFENFYKELNLPEKGVVLDDDVAKIREIYRKACKKGNGSASYYKSIARLFGLDVEIYEYWNNPEKFEGIEDSEQDKRFYWMIEHNIPIGNVKIFKCISKCNEPLRWWTKPFFEKLINDLKPSHTKCLFAYKGT